MFMELRATLAALLAVVLLSLSSAASTCELRCDLANVGAPCHGNAPASGQDRGHAMSSEMPGMRMAAVPQEHGAGLGAVDHAITVAVPDTCNHPVCPEKPVLLKDESGRLARIPLSYHVVALLATLLWSKAPTVFSARGAPPVATSTPVSLHTTLRV